MEGVININYKRAIENLASGTYVCVGVFGSLIPLFCSSVENGFIDIYVENKIIIKCTVIPLSNCIENDIIS